MNDYDSGCAQASLGNSPRLDIIPLLHITAQIMAGFVKLLNHKSFDHESRIIRFSNGLDSPISRLFGLETPSAFFFLAIQQYGEKRCLAFRKIVAHVLETKLLGDWQYYTYAEVGQRVREMGAGLKKLLGGKKVQRLHMAAANRCVCFNVGTSQHV